MWDQRKYYNSNHEANRERKLPKVQEINNILESIPPIQLHTVEQRHDQGMTPHHQSHDYRRAYSSQQGEQPAAVISHPFLLPSTENIQYGQIISMTTYYSKITKEPVPIQKVRRSI